MENPFTTIGSWGAHPGFFYAAVAIFALLAGSFLNVVIFRLPVMMDRAWRRECREMLASEPVGAADPHEHLSLALPPSSCPRCGHRIRPWENVPLLSYLVLRGRCSACRQRISVRYPLVELLSAVLSIAVAWRFGPHATTPLALLFTWSLVALAVIDLDHHLLPDSICLPLLWAGLLLNSAGIFVPLAQSVWGAAIGYGCLWSVYWAFRLATGKEGMGYGDFKLLAALGAWLGWKALPLVVIVSSALGAGIGVALILLRRRDRNAPIPFGPFLALAGWFALMWNGTSPPPWP